MWTATFYPCDGYGARDDDGDAGQRGGSGEGTESQPSRQRRQNQLDVHEGRDGGGRRAAECLDEQAMAKTADAADRYQQEQVGRGKRRVIADEGNGQSDQQRPDDAGVEKKHDKTLAGELASEDLEDGIERGRREREQRRGVKRRFARLHDENDANATGNDEQPARTAMTFPQQPRRHGGDDGRRAVVEAGRLGEWQE